MLSNETPSDTAFFSFPNTQYTLKAVDYSSIISICDVMEHRCGVEYFCLTSTCSSPAVKRPPCVW